MTTIKDLPKLWLAQQKEDQQKKINELFKAEWFNKITGFNEYLTLQNKIWNLIVEAENKIGYYDKEPTPIEYCYDKSHKKMLSNDGRVRCLDCNLTKLSAEHHLNTMTQHTLGNINEKENLLNGLEIKGYEEKLYSHQTVMDVMEEYKSLEEGADATKELLSDIISWEKDLSEYMSLEAILKKRYKIEKRTIGEFMQDNGLGDEDMKDDRLEYTDTH